MSGPALALVSLAFFAGGFLGLFIIGACAAAKWADERQSSVWWYE